MSKSVLSMGLIMVVSLVVFGCGKGGSGGIVPVTGVVTLDGAPVEGATVTFSPVIEGGTSSVGMTDATGKFSLLTAGRGTGAVPGSYKVLVAKSSGGPVATQPKSQEEGMKAMMDKMKSGGLVPKSAAKVEDLLPVKYKALATTDLTAEVKAGAKNDFPLALKK